MPKDYRVILYRHEWEDLLREKSEEERRQAPYFADVLLQRIFMTDARKLARLYPKWTEGQRTLYALNAFIGEVLNGGVSQFLFNPCGILRHEVLDRLQRVGADEFAERYLRDLERYENAEDDLERLRTAALKPTPAWEGYLRFKRRFEAERGEGDWPDFNTWFYDGQEDRLLALLRAHVQAHAEDFVVFCDGMPAREREKVTEELGLFVRKALAYSTSDFWREFCGDLFVGNVLVPEAEDPKRRAAMAASVLLDKARLLRSLSRGRCEPSFIHHDSNRTVKVRAKVGLFGIESATFHREGHGWKLAEWA